MPSKSELRRQWASAGPNVVVLHQLPRARTSPSLSPFPLKFETFLRVAKIEYVNDFTTPMSPKGKTPWMTFNGHDMADSQMCIEHLGKTLGKDLSQHLTAEQRAVARAMRAVLEDNLYFCAAMDRYGYGDINYVLKVMAPVPFPDFLVKRFMGRMAKKVVKQCKGQGIGRHSHQEILALAKEDFKTLSDYLGSKPFVMGSEPTEIDCVLFGFTCMLFHAAPDDHVFRTLVETDFANLKDHMLRIKERFWPDWNDCLYTDKKK